MLLPLVKTRTAAGDLGVTREAGGADIVAPRRALSTAPSSIEQDADALGLVDGQSLRGTAGLERRFGSRDSTAIEYSLESALARQSPEAAEGDGGQYYLTHFGSLQWSHLLSPRSGFLLEAGASYTPDAARGRPGAAGELLRRGQLQPPGEALQRHALRAPGSGPGLRPRGEPHREPLWPQRDDPDGTRLDPRRLRARTSCRRRPRGPRSTYGTPDEASVILATASRASLRDLRARAATAVAAPRARPRDRRDTRSACSCRWSARRAARAPDQSDSRPSTPACEGRGAVAPLLARPPVGRTRHSTAARRTSRGASSQDSGMAPPRAKLRNVSARILRSSQRDMFRT